MKFFKLISISFFLTVSFPGAGRRICRFLRAVASLGVAGLLHARTLLTTKSGLFAGGAISGRGENVLGGMDIVGAAARRGKNAPGGYSIEFENSVYTRPAESNCMKRFVGVNSFNSLICHPFMHAPSLARVFDGKSGGVSDGLW